MKNYWWKLVCVILLMYTFCAGFFFSIPKLNILEESIRNLFFHVPMWFAMMFLMFASLFYSLKYLNTFDSEFDLKASSFATVGFLFGILGITTGSVWAKATWGAWWVFSEPKLNGSAAALLIYAAYFILRSSFEDKDKSARFSAVYNIFAFVMFIAFIMIIPRITDSLHPGNGGNPGFNAYDLDNRLRLVFYPACIAWILLSYWIYTLVIRTKKIQNRLEDIDVLQ
ncbi:MAG: cytochrome c biogenesis protein CcsA [Sphingobacteriales bacterium]|nr:MAG: cytochrome c biogenesis protein CcsA [Sphingobacteriales bacterium]